MELIWQKDVKFMMLSTSFSVSCCLNWNFRFFQCQRTLALVFLKYRLISFSFEKKRSAAYPTQINYIIVGQSFLEVKFVYQVVISHFSSWNFLSLNILWSKSNNINNSLNKTTFKNIYLEESNIEHSQKLLRGSISKSNCMNLCLQEDELTF